METVYNSKSYHYDFVGFTNFQNVYNGLVENLPYHRIAYKDKRQVKEIYYDIPKGLFAEAGIVISKWVYKNQAKMSVKKVNNKGDDKQIYKKASLGDCDILDIPRDYAFKITNIIEKSFRTPFTVDIESLIRQTEPFMEIEIKSKAYELICGNGSRALMIYEDSIYKDLKTNNKVMQSGITFKFPEEDEKSRQELLDLIERKIKGIVLSKYSRFEIGYKLLYTASSEPIDFDEEDSE